MDMGGTIQTHNEDVGFGNARGLHDLFTRFPELDSEFRLDCQRGIPQSQLLEPHEDVQVGFVPHLHDVPSRRRPRETLRYGGRRENMHQMEFRSIVAGNGEGMTKGLRGASGKSNATRTDFTPTPSPGSTDDMRTPLPGIEPSEE